MPTDAINKLLFTRFGITEMPEEEVLLLITEYKQGEVAITEYYYFYLLAYFNFFYADNYTIALEYIHCAIMMTTLLAKDKIYFKVLLNCICNFIIDS